MVSFAHRVSLCCGLAVAFAALAVGLLVPAAHAATPASTAGPTLNPALLPQIEAATFEVVAAKPKDTLKYAQPLPLDLLPYQERTDKYHPIGTAFAIGPNEFVTAGHVLTIGAESLWGPPELRDAKGHVYAIDQILKFALRRDFLVFSLKDPPKVTPLPLDTHPALNQVVYSVGNAEGAGIVIRNGLYTSNTPENQSGAWNWIRFSAAASPGNSGGPLLDQDGKVIGVVLMKSPSETLNYALPISQVSAAPPDLARYDKLVDTSFPLIHITQPATFNGDFPLPKTLEGFFDAYVSAVTAFNTTQLRALFADHRGQMFPNGTGSERVLNTQAPPDRLPHFLVRPNDGNWEHAGKPLKKIPLAADGYFLFGSVGDAGLAHLRRPDDIPAAAFYHSPERVMDLIDATGFLTRTIAQQKIPITSMGAPTTTVNWTDRWGRRWQIWAWPIPFANQYLIVGALPVPDGYSMFFFKDAARQLTTDVNVARQMTSFVTVSYVGTLAQWRDFLSETSLLPEAFKDIHIAFDYGKDFQYTGPRVALSVAPSLQKIQADSTLWLGFSFFHSNRADKAVWNVSQVGLEDSPSDQHWAWVVRHNAPPAGIGTNYEDIWNKIARRKQPFDGVVSGNGNGGSIIRGVVPTVADGDAQRPSVLYTAYLQQPGTQPQAAMKQQLDQLMQGVKLVVAK